MQPPLGQEAVICRLRFWFGSIAWIPGLVILGALLAVQVPVEAAVATFVESVIESDIA